MATVTHPHLALPLDTHRLFLLLNGLARPTPDDLEGLLAEVRMFYEHSEYCRHCDVRLERRCPNCRRAAD